MRKLTLVVFFVLASCGGGHQNAVQKATIFDQDARTDSKSVAEGVMRLSGHWVIACQTFTTNTSKSSAVTFNTDNTGSTYDQVFNSTDCSGNPVNTEMVTFKSMVTKVYGTDKDFGLDISYNADDPSEGKTSSLALRIELMGDDGRYTTLAAMAIIGGRPTNVPQDQVDKLPTLKMHRRN